MLGIKRDRVDILKGDLARWYKAYRAEQQDYDYDCGNTMLQYIHPELAEMAKRINDIAAELQQIDPTFPKGWVPL